MSMFALTVALTGLAALIAIIDYRKGLLAVLLIGVLQDVFRKLTPGVPTYYILWAMAVFVVVVGSAWRYRRVAPMRVLWLQDGLLRFLWSLFAVVIAVQFLHSLIRWGFAVPVLGVIEYLVPVLAVLFGVGVSRGRGEFRWLMTRYSAIAVPTALTVYLSVKYSEGWPVLRDVGTFIGSELLISSVGENLRSYSGLFRTGEIAAWHAATGAVFLLVLAQRKQNLRSWIMSGLMVGLLVGAIIYTGRRKMLMALTIFIVIRIVSEALVSRGFGRRSFALVVGAVAIGVLPGLLPDSNPYVTRSVSVYSSVGERSGTALDLFRSAIARSDGIGLGIGVYAQGSRYAGVDLSSVVGGAGEAGVGKLILEIGLPGLLVVALVLSRTVLKGWRILRWMAKVRDPMLPTALSLAAFLAGQIATFIVATQIYGDPFVLIVLGLVAGAFFGLLARAEQQRRATVLWNSSRGPVARAIPMRALGAAR